MSAGGTVIIDGAIGEGGGQIVRTALSLAMISGRPLKLVNIRAGRAKPGLAAQHLTALNACGSVCQAETSGAALGSREVFFRPGKVRSGRYRFRIGTAGAVSLVLQCILPALAMAGGESRLTISGGTHVPWSPPFHYLAQVFLPTIEKLGFRCEASLSRWGWYPKGGGMISARIERASPVLPGFLSRPFRARRLTGISASSRLPEHIRTRQKDRLLARLQPMELELKITLEEVDALDRGSFLFACVEGQDTVAGFSSLGAKGKPAEQVADETADSLLSFLRSGAALDPHLADQVLIYLAMAAGEVSFSTSAITPHLLTNAWVIEQFLPVEFEIRGVVGKPGVVVKRERGEREPGEGRGQSFR